MTQQQRNGSRPGQRVARNNSGFKHDLGAGANAVSNRFLAQCKGREILVQQPGQPPVVGRLNGFDLYALEIRVASTVPGRTIDVLIFKGPGVLVQEYIPE